MSRIFLFLFFFIFITSFSQNGLFEKGRSKTLQAVTSIDQKDVLIIDSIKLVIDDSIKVEAKKFLEKIVANNILNNSKSFFEIKYYLKKGKLFFVQIAERSPRYSDLKKHTEYFVIDGKISDINHY